MAIFVSQPSHAQNTDTGTSASEFNIDTGGDNVAVKAHVQDASKHREINDAGTAATETWSASKVNTELAGKAATSHNHAKSDVTDFAEADYVHVTGAESVGGVKTFSSFPVTPSSAPTADYQVANKKYVDDIGAGGNDIRCATAVVKTGGIVGTDCDYTTIDAALASGNKRVYVLPGAYSENPALDQQGTVVFLESGVTVTGSWTISASECGIIGQGKDSYINGDDGKAITITSTGAYALIKDVAINTTSGATSDGIDVSADYVRVEGVTIINTLRAGIFHDTATTGLTVLNCHFIDTGSWGIYMGQDSTNFRIRGNIVNSAVNQAIYCSGAQGIVSQNQVLNSSGDAIVINDSSCVVSGNVIYDAGGDGIQVGAGCNYCSITGNSINTTSDDGIYLVSGGTNNLVVGNNIKGYTNEGIDDDSTGSTVASNEITA